jgi:sulfur carrier protein
MSSISINGRAHPLSSPGLTLADLVAELDLAGKRIAVELNGRIVPRSAYADTPLAEGDRVEIVGAVGGG